MLLRRGQAPKAAHAGRVTIHRASYDSPSHLERASRCWKHLLALDPRASLQETHHDLSTIPDLAAAQQRYSPPGFFTNGVIPRHAPTRSGRQRRQSQSARILAAIRTLQVIEQAERPATPEERAVLARFPASARWLWGYFPIRSLAATRMPPGSSWVRSCGAAHAEDYASAKRTTFTAFYTAPVVMQAMYMALARLGVPRVCHVLEPGCGIGNFLATLRRACALSAWSWTTSRDGWPGAAP